MTAPADAVAAIRARTTTAPKIAVILGSGLGALAGEVAGATRIPYGDVPGWQRSTAPDTPASSSSVASRGRTSRS